MLGPWIVCGGEARRAPPAVAAMSGRFLAACLRGCGTSPEFQRTISIAARARSAAVTFANLSLRSPCFEQRVHSGLYDGLTWPDNGYASLD